MSAVVIAGAVWVLLASPVAMLPLRMQYIPGVILLLAAPPLIVWFGLSHGVLAALAALAGFVSMFRNPLRYLWKRARGERPEIPT